MGTTIISGKEEMDFFKVYSMRKSKRDKNNKSRKEDKKLLKATSCA